MGQRPQGCRGLVTYPLPHADLKNKPNRDFTLVLNTFLPGDMENNMENPKPPRMAEWLLGLISKLQERFSVMGDFEEM